MKKDILHHCKHCAVCEKFKTEQIKFKRLNLSTPRQPMEFISMDLIGVLPPNESRSSLCSDSSGHANRLCLLCTVKNKKAEEIVQVYLNEVYYRFGGSRKDLI